ncbi:MAG: L,D-transpeptidase [Bifidobacterium psychraerophilum]|uniref:L,D-transpeptidase n=1 Tax=Bifidobacterium psychraerophilum TaxID=218140 RepID=UPI0039E86082
MSDGKHSDDETSSLFPNGENRDFTVSHTDAGEPTVQFVPLRASDWQDSADENKLGQDAGFAALSPNRKRGHKGLIVTVALLLLLAAAAVGAFFAAQSYFSDKAAPGVDFAGQSVTGQDEAALTKTVNAAYDSSTVSIKDSSGKTLTATLKDLGVSVDTKATVQQLLSAKSSDAIGHLNPLSTTSIPLTLKTDEAKMTDFLTDKLVDSDQQAHAATVSYDAASKSFVAKAGSDGQTPQISTVKAAVSKLSDDPGTTVQASVTYSDVAAPITEQTAQEAAASGNQRLSQAITIESGEGKTLSIPATEVAKWISYSSDLDKGTMTLVYDQDAIKSYLSDNLAKALNQDVVNEENVKNTQGTVLTVTTKGVVGVAVKDTDTTAAEVVKSLDAGQGGTIKAQSDVTKYSTSSKVARYDVANGDLWIQVDRSKQVVTVYKGTTVVKTFNVVTGKNGDRESDPGTFFINIKYETQDMRGADYLSKGVKWISYYNGGEGFHAAPWNLTGIAKGDPVNYGSHGCINMIPSDAEWIYKNAPVGTMVKVIGAQPTAAVR